MLNSTIRPGELAPRELDCNNPVVNIGSHPENDIVLTGPTILPFHATVQSQDGHFSLFALGDASRIKIGGQVPSASPAIFSPGEPVAIGDYVLTFQKKGDAEGMHVSIASTAGGIVPVKGIGGFPANPSQTGECPILVNAANPQAEAQVGQTVEYELEMVNAGPIVAGISIAVQGIPENWVKIEPATVNLFEGQHGTARISVTPPHSPESTAGEHTILVVVSSANYAGYFSRTPLTLNILPFYEFTVGSLSPRQTRIHWRKHSGVVKLPISNMGNSEADFNITAFDDENGCSFDFQVSKDKERSRQATVPIPAGQSTSLPIQITPLKHPVAALRNRSYHYTATAQVAVQPTLSQAVSGTATSVPLFGWWTIVLTALLVIAGVFLLVQPRIYKFDVLSGKDVIVQGDSTTLDWSVSPFATSLSLSNIEQALTRNQTSLTVVPNQSTTYQLAASNWLAGLFGLNQKRSQTILVVPPTPVINVFEVDKTSVPEGTPVTIRWSVSKADKVLLTIDKVVYELKSDQFSGEQQVTLAKDSLVTLEAVSASGSQLRSYYIKVVAPYIKVNSFIVWVRASSTVTSKGTAAVISNSSHLTLSRMASLGTGVNDVTPPDPNFPDEFVALVADSTADTGYRVQFFQPNRELTKGQQILVQWDIDGAENNQLAIAPFTDTLPNKGAQPFFPQESMNFVLTAKSGNLQKIFMLPVTVFDGTPPAAPKIEFFQATPASIIGPGDVQFAWSVSGEWTRITLTTQNNVIADYMNPQGFKTVNVTQSGTYILTACNGTLCSSSPKDITVNPALIDPGLIISSISPTTGRSQIGGKLNVTIQFTKIPTGTTFPTGSITVTDSAAICTITLPAMACGLQFTTSGTKSLTASFPGDKIYQQSISPAFAQQVVVASALVDLLPSFYFNGSTTPVSVETNSFDMDKGIHTIVEVRPQNTVLADNNGSINVSLCDQDANEAVVMDSCIFVGAAQVKVASADSATQTQGYGYADITITNFNASGTKGLLFEYTHSQNAIDPTSKFQPNIHINRTRIALSLSSCTDPINFTTCTLGMGAGTTQELIFDLNVPVSSGTVPLTSLLPAPQITAFTISSNPSATWNCSIKVMSGTYKLDCKVTGFTSGTSYNVTFDYNNNDPIVPTTGTPVRNDYYMGADPTVPFGGQTFQLKVLSITKTLIGNLIGVRVGDRIKITGPSTAPGIISILDGSNIRLFPTTGVTLTAKNATDALDVAEQAGVNCTVDTAGSTITVKAANADCYVFFKHAGNYTLEASFAGDNLNNGSTSSDLQVAVQKQTQISGELQYLTAGAYAVGAPSDLITNTATTFRVQFDGPDSNFSPDIKMFPPTALAGRNVLVTLSGWGAQNDANGNPNCKIDTSSLVKDDSGGVYEVTITQQPSSDPQSVTDPSTITYVTVADFNVTCSSKNSLGLSFAVTFSDKSTPKDSDDFAFTTGVDASNIRVDEPSKGSMTVSMVREDAGSTAMISGTTISTLHFGQIYDLGITGDDFGVSYDYSVDYTHSYTCLVNCSSGAWSVNIDPGYASSLTRGGILTGYNNSANWTVDPSNFLSLDTNLATTGSNCKANMPLTSREISHSEGNYWVLISRDVHWNWGAAHWDETDVYRAYYRGIMNVQLYTTNAQKCTLLFDGRNSNTPFPTDISHTINVSAVSGDTLFAPNNTYTVNGIDKQAVQMTITPSSSSGSPLSAYSGSDTSVAVSLVSKDISGGTPLPFVDTPFSTYFSPGLDTTDCPDLTQAGSVTTSPSVSITETYNSPTASSTTCANNLRYLGNRYYQEFTGQTYLNIIKHSSSVSFGNAPSFLGGNALPNVSYPNITVKVTDADGLGHTSPVPSGSIKFEIMNGGSALDCSSTGAYVLNGATCASTFYTLPVTNGITAAFNLLFKPSTPTSGNTIQLTYSGDSNFSAPASAFVSKSFSMIKHTSSVAFTSDPTFVGSGRLTAGTDYSGLSITASDADNPKHTDLTPTGNVTLQLVNSTGTPYACSGATVYYTISVGTCDATNTYTIPLLDSGVTSFFVFTVNSPVTASNNNKINLGYSGDTVFKTANSNTSNFRIQ